ncbi:MAG: redoxin domain-containing protein [Actinomycetota bacterium]
MTQLVELHHGLPELAAEGIKLYAISYDDVDALAAYVEASGVEFTMLSDVGSEIIRRYDVLNTIVQPSDVPFYGIPFPGFFLLDEDGLIVDKIFNRHLAHREGIERILDSFRGRIEPGADGPSNSAAEDDDIHITAFLRGGGGVVKIGPLRRLVVRFELPDGLHIYDRPVPEGMVATSIEVTGPDGLRYEPIQSPPTTPLALPGIDQPLQVWSGTVDFVIPFFANTEFARSLFSDDGSVALEVTVRYQACDAEQCFLPKRHTITLDVPVDFGVMPAFDGMKGRSPNVIGMDSTAHMQRLLRRKAAELDPESS